MDRTCVVCHSNAAAVQCFQCHKPVCGQCGFKDENGAFCSRGCAATYREFRQSQAVRGGGGTVVVPKGLIVLIVLAVAAFVVAWYMGWLPAGIRQWLP